MSQNNKKEEKDPKAPTVSEWIRALESVEAIKESQEGMTFTELHEATRVGVSRLREWMRSLQKEGRLIVGKRMGRSLTGSPISTPTYRIKPKKSGKKDPS